MALRVHIISGMNAPTHHATAYSTTTRFTVGAIDFVLITYTGRGAPGDRVEVYTIGDDGVEVFHGYYDQICSFRMAADIHPVLPAHQRAMADFWAGSGFLPGARQWGASVSFVG